jgi:hypothetical protein
MILQEVSAKLRLFLLRVSYFRATSHTSMKARDHCILESFIGRKGRDRPSSLHTGR